LKTVLLPTLGRPTMPTESAMGGTTYPVQRRWARNGVARQ
jgi:hypothetical protein